LKIYALWQSHKTAKKHPPRSIAPESRVPKGESEKRGNPPGQDIDTQLPLARNNVLATWACQMLRILAYCSTVGRGRGGIAHLSWGIGSEGTPSPYLPHTHTIHTHTQQRVNLFKLTTCKVYLRLGPNHAPKPPASGKDLWGNCFCLTVCTNFTFYCAPSTFLSSKTNRFRRLRTGIWD